MHHPLRRKSNPGKVPPAYQVVVVYEDLYNAYRAFDTCNEVSHKLHQVCTFDIRLWNFRELQHVQSRAEAVQATATAAMIIIASYGQGKLPPVLFRWISEWLPLREHRAGILVALLARKTKGAFSTSPKLSFFKQVAWKAHLDFCSDHGDLLGSNGQGKLISTQLARPVAPRLNAVTFVPELSLPEAFQLDYPAENN